MTNPIAQMLSNTQSQNLASNISSFLKMMNNPQSMMQQLMANKDPRMSQLMSMINQNGGDPQKLARQMLAQNGIDADQLINQLTNKK